MTTGPASGADAEKYLRIVLQYVTDVNAQGVAVGGADNLRKGLKAVEDQAASTYTQMRMLRRMGSEISQVGRLLTIGGAALTVPLAAAAKAFVDANKSTDATAKSWVAATDKVQAGYLRIGKVAAEQLLPSIKSAADLTDKVATFVEANPGLIKAALSIGGTLAAAGVTLVTAGTVIRSLADIGLLISQLGKLGILGTGAAASGAAGVAGAGAAAGAGGAAGAGAAGLGAGLLAGASTVLTVGGVAIAATVFGKMIAEATVKGVEALVPGIQGGVPTKYQGMGYTDIMAANLKPGQSASLAPQIVNWLEIIATKIGVQGLTPSYGPLQNYPPAYLAQSGAYFNRLQSADSSKRQTEGNATSFYGGYGSETAQARAQALPVYQQYQQTMAQNFSSYTAQDTSIRMDYLKQAMSDTKDFNAQQKVELRNFNEESARLEKSYDQNRLLQIRDFNEQEAQAQKSYDESQAKAATAHGTDMQRLAQDFADQEAQLLMDHGSRSRDLAAAGDALGFVKEQQAYAKQQALDKQNYDKEVTRRNQDYATQQADAKQAFDDQRAQALANFKQQQDDAKAAFNDAQQQRQQQFDQQKSDEQTAFDERELQLKDNFKTQLDDNTTQYNKLQDQATQAFTDQLNAIDPILTGMTKLVQQKMMDASDEFGKFLDGIGSQIQGGPGYCPTGYHWSVDTKSCVSDDPTHYGSASGGYAGFGLRMLGEGTGSLAGPEFVMNALTTRQAEGLLGTKLTQAGLLQGLLRSGGVNVDLGGIDVTGLGSQALLSEVMTRVEEKITGAFSQFGNVLEGL